MFLKPYRTLILEDHIKSAQAWLDKDLAAAPPHIVQSFIDHVEGIQSDRIQYFITPVFRQTVSQKKPPDVSLKYSGADEFILRDLAFGTTIVKSLLEKKMIVNFDEIIKNFFERLSNVYSFLNNSINRDFDRVSAEGNVRYHKSFVVGLKPDAKSVHDMDYVDIFFDDQHDIIPTNKSPNLCPEMVNRTGILLRLYLQPEKALFKIERETVNCSSIAHDGSKYNTINDTINVVGSVFSAYSTEYYFEAYYKDIDSVLVEYLEAHKELLSKRMGYEPTVIDKDTLKVIDMIVI